MDLDVELDVALAVELAVDLAVDLDLGKATLLGVIRGLDHAKQGRNASAASQAGINSMPIPERPIGTPFLCRNGR